MGRGSSEGKETKIFREKKRKWESGKETKSSEGDMPSSNAFAAFLLNLFSGREDKKGVGVIAEECARCSPPSPPPPLNVRPSRCGAYLLP